MRRTLRRTWHLPGTNAQSRHVSNEPPREEADQLYRKCIEGAIDDDAAPPFKSAQACSDNLLWCAVLATSDIRSKNSLCWLHGIFVPKMDVFAFHFCGFSKLWHAPVKGCKSISCVSIHDAEVDAVQPHFQ
jgi:hypothetical protein